MKKIFFIALVISTLSVTGCNKSQKITLNTPEGTVKVKHIEDNKVYSIATGIDYYTYLDKNQNSKKYLYIDKELNKMNPKETLAAILAYESDYLSSEDIFYYLDNYSSQEVDKIYDLIKNNEEYIYTGDTILNEDDLNNIKVASIERAVGALSDDEKENLRNLIDYKGLKYKEEIIESYKQDKNLKYVIANYNDHKFEYEKDVWGNNKVDNYGNSIEVRTTLKNPSRATNCELLINDVFLSNTVQEYNVKIKAGEKIKFISYCGVKTGLTNGLRVKIYGAPYRLSLSEVERDGDIVKYESKVFDEDYDLTIRVEQLKWNDLGYTIWI